MIASQPCKLTALGIINALGSGGDAVLANLLQGNAPGMEREAGWVPAASPWCGRARGDLPQVPARLQELASRNNQLLMAALQQIQPELDRVIGAYGPQRVGVVIGSSTSGILEGERALQTFQQTSALDPDYHYRQQEIGTPALFVADLLSLSGIAYTVSTACSSSAKVFASARNLLDLGLCDAVLVGGSDSLCKLTLNGFSALDSVSANRCNPFSANRDGITIGEGAALFLMERGEGAINLLGVGESSDAHHISSPHPEGRGAAAAMQNALKDAALEASAIAYLNLHGTATPQNDAMESHAVHRVMGQEIPCSSTKPLTGHTLGAAGATEIGLCWLLLNQAREGAKLPRQLWDGAYDPALSPIALLASDLPLPAGDHRMMSNSFAFGGSNCSVIIGAL